MDNLTYEMFIRRAWNCDRFEHGADADTWEDLRRAQYEFESARDAASKNKKEIRKTKAAYEKKMKEVKKFICKSCERLIKKSNGADGFLDLKNRVDADNTPEMLWETLNNSFDVLNQFGYNISE